MLMVGEDEEFETMLTLTKVSVSIGWLQYPTEHCPDGLSWTFFEARYIGHPPQAEENIINSLLGHLILSSLDS